MVQLAIIASADGVADGGLEVDHDGAGHVLSTLCFREEGVEGRVLHSDGGIAGHLAILLNAVLEAVKLPTGVTHFETGLADVDG